MGASWSQYTTTESDDSMISLETASQFTCHICGKQKKDLRVQSLSCKHTSCIDCLATASFLGSYQYQFGGNCDTVTSYYPPRKGLFKVPGLCSVCFVENAIKSPNFHQSSFYFKRNNDCEQSI